MWDGRQVGSSMWRPLHVQCGPCLWERRGAWAWRAPCVSSPFPACLCLACPIGHKAGQARAWPAGSCDASRTLLCQETGCSSPEGPCPLPWELSISGGWCGHAPAPAEPGYPSLRVHGAIHLQFLQRAGACTRPQGPREGSGGGVCSPRLQPPRPHGHLHINGLQRGVQGEQTLIRPIQADGSFCCPDVAEPRAGVRSRGRLRRARCLLPLPRGLGLPGHGLRGVPGGSRALPVGKRPAGGRNESGHACGTAAAA